MKCMDSYTYLDLYQTYPKLSDLTVERYDNGRNERMNTGMNENEKQLFVDAPQKL